jgi:hypothetical protein
MIINVPAIPLGIPPGKKLDERILAGALPSAHWVELQRLRLPRKNSKSHALGGLLLEQNRVARDLILLLFVSQYRMPRSRQEIYRSCHSCVIWENPHGSTEWDAEAYKLRQYPPLRTSFLLLLRLTKSHTEPIAETKCHHSRSLIPVIHRSNATIPVVGRNIDGRST